MNFQYRAIAEAAYRGDGWWLVTISCGHQVKVLYGAPPHHGSPLGKDVACRACEYTDVAQSLQASTE